MRLHISLSLIQAILFNMLPYFFLTPILIIVTIFGNYFYLILCSLMLITIYLPNTTVSSSPHIFFYNQVVYQCFLLISIRVESGVSEFLQLKAYTKHIGKNRVVITDIEIVPAIIKMKQVAKGTGTERHSFYE